MSNISHRNARFKSIYQTIENIFNPGLVWSSTFNLKIAWWQCGKIK